MNSIAWLLKICLLVLVWLGLIVLLVSYSIYVYNVATGPTLVQIGAFKVGDEPAEQVASYFIARSKEIGGSIPLEALYEVKVPTIENSFGAEAKSFLEGVKLDVQGVDVPAILRAVSALVPTHHHLVSGFVNFAASGPVLQIEWRQPNDERKVWLVPLDRATDGRTSNKLLLDQAIYRLFYYMYFDEKGPTEWRKKRAAGADFPDFPNEQAFEAYYAGRQRLHAYLRSVSSEELSQAETQFRLLRKEMPQFADGLMLLGLTLSELRDENEAISVYDEAIAVLEPAEKALRNAEATLQTAEKEHQEGERALREARVARLGASGQKDQHLKQMEDTRQAALDRAQRALQKANQDLSAAYDRHLADQKKLLQAQLFKATAQRRLFRWQYNHEALTRLLAIEDRIETLLGNLEALLRHSRPQSEEVKKSLEISRKDFAKIRFATLAEKAQNLSHYLTLLNPPNLATALTSPRVPAGVKPLDEDGTELSALRTTRARATQAVFDRELKRIHELHVGALQAASRQLRELYGNDPAAWPGEARNYSHQHKHAEGDGLLRYAQILDRDDEAFRKRCEEAIRLLKQADAARPNHYGVYQSLARIYADPRFDVRGDHVDTALELYKRSIELKPADFFGRQQLAFLTVREAYLWGPEFLTAEKLNAAIAYAEKARDLRPGSSASFIALSELYALRWAQSRPQARARDRALVEASFVTALNVNRFPERVAVPLAMAKLQWSFLQLRAAEPASFEQAMAGLRSAIDHAASVGEEWSWDARRLHKVATELRDQLAKITHENRASLQWPVDRSVGSPL